MNIVTEITNSREGASLHPHITNIWDFVTKINLYVQLEVIFI